MSLQDSKQLRIVIGLVWVALALVLSCSKEQRPAAESNPLVEFGRRVEEYAALHHRLADTMGPLDETKSQAEIAARAATLAHLIQNERATAKQGDILFPAAAAAIKAILQQEYSSEPDSVRRTREAQEKEYREDGLPDFTPTVNTLYPTTYPLITFPPGLLPLLPKLPSVVEYRVLSGHLLLRDVEANLIIDFVPQAVP